MFILLSALFVIGGFILLFNVIEEDRDTIEGFYLVCYMISYPILMLSFFTFMWDLYTLIDVGMDSEVMFKDLPKSFITYLGIINSCIYLMLFVSVLKITNLPIMCRDLIVSCNAKNSTSKRINTLIRTIHDEGREMQYKDVIVHLRAYLKGKKNHDSDVLNIVEKLEKKFALNKFSIDDLCKAVENVDIIEKKLNDESIN
jgi:hypothetical protein